MRKRNIKKRDEKKRAKKLWINLIGPILVLLLGLLTSLSITNPEITGMFTATQNNNPNNNNQEETTIHQQIVNPPQTIKVDFTKEIGKIREDFYGVNVQGRAGGTPVWVDANDDGNLDTLSNYTWHREKLLEMNVKY